MSEIHKTTLTPSKLELVTAWLPAQPWYRGGGIGPQLSKAGGFRLDDPEGEVGIEFMVVADEQPGGVTYYQVVATYRGAPLDGAEAGLLGTMQHGVLGKRWTYDGAYDPVAVSQLFALAQGAATPQAQSESHTPDPTVVGSWPDARNLKLVASSVGENDGAGTTVVLEGTDDDGTPRSVLLSIVRVLEVEASRDALGSGVTDGLGHVSANWINRDDTRPRGVFARFISIDD